MIQKKFPFDYWQYKIMFALGIVGVLTIIQFIGMGIDTLRIYLDLPVC